MTDVRAILQAFFASAFPNRRLGDSDDIFALGFANSLFAMELVEFIEHRFGVTIESDDLELDNFRSIASLDTLVARKRQAAATA